MRWILVATAGAGCVGQPAPEGLVLALESPQEGSIVDGGELFSRVWQPHDPRSASGDGLGPMYNATSCEGCHFQGGIGGSGPDELDVVIETVGGVSTVLHRSSTVEGYSRGDATSLGFRGLGGSFGRGSGSKGDIAFLFGSGSLPDVPVISSRNTPALFGIGLIDEIDEADILAGAQVSHADWPEVSGRPARTPTGDLGRLGWKGSVASVADFVEQACGVELGLETPRQPQSAALHDPNGQSGVGIDMTTEEVAALTAFVSDLPRPVARTDHPDIAAGRAVFEAVGCHTCHTPDLGGVSGLYSDLLLHDMGDFLSNAATVYGFTPPEEPTDEDAMATSREWRTPPLWGLRDSAPYLHDGRSATLTSAIQRHAGEATDSREAWSALSGGEKTALIDFLLSLAGPSGA